MAHPPPHSDCFRGISALATAYREAVKQQALSWLKITRNEKAVLSLLFACVLTGAFAQTKIDLNEVAKHVGDGVTVEGKIYGVKVLHGPASPVLLDLGAAYPAQLLTIAVFPTYKGNQAVMPTEDNKGNLARVTGRIELYQGKPQIAVRSSSQLSLRASDAVTPAKQ